MKAKDDVEHLERAIEISRRCPPSREAFSVGAVILDREGREIATGYSRETGEKEHAEEVAITKARRAGAETVGGTIYTSLEPCGRRLSKPKTCAEHVVEAGIRRVVYALGEPSVFVEATGADKLREAGVEVVVVGELAPLVEAVNRHLLDDSK